MKANIIAAVFALCAIPSIAEHTRAELEQASKPRLVNYVLELESGTRMCMNKLKQISDNNAELIAMQTAMIESNKVLVANLRKTTKSLEWHVNRLQLEKDLRESQRKVFFSKMRELEVKPEDVPLSMQEDYADFLTNGKMRSKKK